MSGAIPPLTQYAFMAWCSVKRSTGIALPLPSIIIIIIIIIIIMHKAESFLRG
jgi:hypothetical protein